MGSTGADAKSICHRTRISGSAPGNTLPDDVVEEILRRLLARSLFRFRAASLAWRTLTSIAGFVSAFSSTKPALPLVALYSKPGSHHESSLDSVDVLAAANHTTHLVNFECYRHWLCASVDGLLLLSASNGRHSIFNPVTRQLIPLKQLTGTASVFVGMYQWKAADGGAEYRIIFSRGRLPKMNPTYYVFTVGSPMEPRVIQLPEGPENLKMALLRGINDPIPRGVSHRPALLLNRRLHWVPESCKHDEVLVFDMVATFASMQSPTAAQDRTRLFEMDNRLVFSLYDDKSKAVSVWMLDDYRSGIWVL